MYIRRIELLLMGVLLLVANWFIMSWWSDPPVDAAIASRLTQSAQTAQTSSIPNTFAYQGTLRLADGNLANGSFSMTLRLYSDASGGSALYEEELNTVAVRDGLFNVVVGDTNPIPSTVFANAPLYLGITVGSDPEMIPRQRLHPVPWAMQATTLIPDATVNGLHVDKKATVNELHVDGKLGIGISDPEEALHIKGGNLRIDNNGAALITSWGKLDFYPDNDQSGDDEIRFLDSDKNVNVMISNNGNVGIGKSNPTAKLDVQGDISWSGHLNMKVTEEFFVENTNPQSNGYQSIDMISAENSLCFLVQMAFKERDIHSSNNWDDCYIDESSSGNWRLNAKAQADDMAQCKARCLEW